jgi:hypothetical protein
MNTSSTLDSYKESLIPLYKTVEQKEGEAWAYGDNAKPHIATKCQEFLNDNDIKHFAFGGHPINADGGIPPNSPDLSCIELLFHTWGNKVYARHPLTVEELIKFGNEEWEKIECDEIQKYFLHMQKVIQYIIQNNGKLYSK